MNNEPMRVRMTYAKLGNLRFIGHLDLQRLFERALRRTNLPLRYTQGFSPHMRINLASALPLGFIGEAEQMDFWLDDEVSLDEISNRLNKALPAELILKNLQVIDNQLPSLQASLLTSEFEIVLPPDLEPGNLQDQMNALLEQDSLPVQRRKKTVDLKNLILTWQLDCQPAKTLMVTSMKATPLENGRPDELLVLLGIDPADCVITRTKMVFSEE
ncbi:MAG TPA: TIGR03936 family radical SAM-associated protein [Anaerolineaceae bacterium]|nr:TIGR03936 family radical SAM-associated protein [Anaerolineaceae bacterium]